MRRSIASATSDPTNEYRHGRSNWAGSRDMLAQTIRTTKSGDVKQWIMSNQRFHSRTGPNSTAVASGRGSLRPLCALAGVGCEGATVEETPSADSTSTLGVAAGMPSVERTLADCFGGAGLPLFSSSCTGSTTGRVMTRIKQLGAEIIPSSFCQMDFDRQYASVGKSVRTMVSGRGRMW